jgi:hypothetical protein
MEQGMRPDLIGGGLLRSAGGWQAVGALRNTGIHQKSDERTLGDGDFVEHVLLRAKERLHGKYEMGDGFAGRTYRAFVEKGMEQGMRPDLIGGGLLRSAGGWQAVGALRKAGIHQKSDERMLGDGDFVEHVLLRAKERLHGKYVLASKGIGFEQLARWVSELTATPLPAMAGPGKQRKSVRARSILCFLAVNGLGMPLTDLAARLGICLPTVSVAVRRGGEIVAREKLGIAQLRI